MFLVVGLGNPGKTYASHRHNVGFMVIEDLAARVRADSFREKFSGQIARALLGDEQAYLLAPQTYMNESGRSVQPALAFHKIALTNLIVVHDELDLPFGQVRLKVGGGHAGHNGLRSIMAHVGTGDFIRLRVGIGRPPPAFGGEVADYVLSSFDPVERANLPDILKQATETVLEVAARGVAAAMNVRNSRPKAGKKQAKEQGAEETSAPVVSPGQTVSAVNGSQEAVMGMLISRSLRTKRQAVCPLGRSHDGSSSLRGQRSRGHRPRGAA